MNRLEGRVALVTGAAQGIGAAIARAFSAEGARVACVDLQAAEVEAVASTIEGKAFGFDLADTSAIPGLVDSVESALGPITILVNCAGICPTQGFDQITEAVLRKTFDINVIGPFMLLHNVGSRMASRDGGSIINVASISAFLPKLEQLEYGASKAAIVSMTRSAALSLGPKGVRVNAIAPGVIDTPMTQANAERRSKIRGITKEEALQPLIDAAAVRRMGSPEEVASLVVFLASGESSFISGQTIDVCGGQLMR